jgi:hypothetical protein
MIVHARDEDVCKRRRLEKSMYTVLYTTQSIQKDKGHTWQTKNH